MCYGMYTQAPVVVTIFISFDSVFDLGLSFFLASIRPRVTSAPLAPPAPPISPNVMVCKRGEPMELYRIILYDIT